MVAEVTVMVAVAALVEVAPLALVIEEASRAVVAATTAEAQAKVSLAAEAGMPARRAAPRGGKRVMAGQAMAKRVVERVAARSDPVAAVEMARETAAAASGVTAAGWGLVASAEAGRAAAMDAAAALVAETG